MDRMATKTAIGSDFQNRRFGQDDRAPGVQMENYIESEDQGSQL